MSLQLGATRDALLEAGASPESASRAAEELAGYENRLASIETRLTLLSWMVGIQLPLLLTLFVRSFTH